MICGSMICLKATLHPIVALSTNEREHLVLVEENKEDIWLKTLMNDLKFL